MGGLDQQLYKNPGLVSPLLEGRDLKFQQQDNQFFNCILTYNIVHILKKPNKQYHQRKHLKWKSGAEQK